MEITHSDSILSAKLRIAAVIHDIVLEEFSRYLDPCTSEVWVPQAMCCSLQLLLSLSGHNFNFVLHDNKSKYQTSTEISKSLISSFLTTYWQFMCLLNISQQFLTTQLWCDTFLEKHERNYKFKTMPVKFIHLIIKQYLTSI